MKMIKIRLKRQKLINIFFYLIEFCKDTSDYLSSDEEENTFATMEVVEYEVASESSSDGGLYSHDSSSSGTDVINFFLF